MTADLLTRRALNRAVLARQLLLTRADLSAAQAISHLLGLQSQAPNPPYVGLWSRLAEFRFSDLSDLLRTRAAVRIALMRSTIHLVTAADALLLRPFVQPMLDRSLAGSYRKALAGVDPERLAVVARRALGRAPLTFAELGGELAEHWPNSPPQALSQAARTYVPMVQVPPRGIWGQGGPARHVPVETWLGPV